MGDEQEYAAACRRAIDECRRLGYPPNAWLSMLDRWGAVEASKKLVRNGDIQSGLLRLLRLGREDLTVEKAILDPHWEDLFTDDDRELARWRLEQAHGDR